MAAQTTTNMIRAFRNVRYGLLVGVGGGAPKRPGHKDSRNDIRLGDIVVGPAKGSHGKKFPISVLPVVCGHCTVGNVSFETVSNYVPVDIYRLNN